MQQQQQQQFGAPQMQQQQQPQQAWGYQQAAPQAYHTSSAAPESDFGDFEAARGAPPVLGAAASAPAPAPAKNQWGDIDKLVNLSGISKNEDEKAKAAAASATVQYSQNSFAGLDGFSKPQSMVSHTPFSLPDCSYQFVHLIANTPPRSPFATK